MRRRRHLCLAAATLALLTAGAAQGAPPSEINSASEPAASPAKAERGGGLPFSGLDVALFAAGGGPLLLIGASLRRRQRQPAVQPAQEETLTLA